MKYLASIAAMLICLILAPLAVAKQDAYPPKLDDIMITTQLRHIKLWFAGKLRNWELAAYEVERIKASLANAAELYLRDSGGVRDGHSRARSVDPRRNRGEGQHEVRQGV